jgi:hypothetical protein
LLLPPPPLLLLLLLLLLLVLLFLLPLRCGVCVRSLSCLCALRLSLPTSPSLPIFSRVQLASLPGLCMSLMSLAMP